MRVSGGRVRAAVLAVAIMLGDGSGLVQLAAQKSAETSADVAAYVGDAAIRADEIDRAWHQRDPVSYARLRRELYDARRRVLYGLIAERLLADLAREREIPVEVLLQREASRRARPVTPADVAAFIAANPLPLTGSSQATPLITALLEQRAQEVARAAFVEAIRDDPRSGVRVLLEPPRTVVAPAAHNPTRGLADAPVKVIVFSDFQCPFCRRTEPVLERLIDRFPDRILLVWRHFPLSIHADARPAAEAAQCAADQGRFWEYHDALFASQRLDPAALLTTARQLELDVESFSRCLDAHTHAPAVGADVEAGERAGVSGTPTIFINGVAFVGALSFETYERAIVEALRAVDRDPSPSPDKER